MDLPENNDATDKSWDHPWTTDEMRQHQNDWSLAADAGLLKHLQQFSDNLTQQFSKTEEKLNSLSSDLEEASVIIDNITNTSLALANTQFIESRVHEDEIEAEHSQSTQEPSAAGKEEPYKDDLIACVSESIKQGLSILDEKFERLEVLASDSEDEGEVPVPSVVLKPKDPYQNRPLPYVIGSEKWKTSSKVGLESSSSDSESPEAEKDSGSESEEEIRQNIAIPSINRHESIRRSLSSSSSSELSGRNEQTNPTKDYSSVSLRNDKLAARSQDTPLNSGSELATPSIAESRTENSSKAAPSFAEELAKRLGKVLPSEQRSVRDHQDADQSSINRYKDDLFAPEDNDVFANKSENLFSDNSNLFDEDVSKSLWKNKPYKPPISNIIPPSLDVPPPMNTEATKPKSAFDDLCGDPESEDSDNIFAPKSSFLSEPSKPRSSSEDKHENSDLRENKFLNVALGENASKMATSTPELNDNGGLFGDDDDDVLFGNPTRSQSRISEKTPELVPPRNRQALPGLSITQADILGSNLGSRLFQRVPRQGSSDSSDTESPVQNPDGRSNDRIVQESDSSGISIRPNNNTANNTLGPDFQPQWESTRLKSEEIYRERFPSDSLFEGRGRNAESTNSIDNSSLREHNEGRFIGETLESGREENLDTDDVFGPPPLPKHNDSKSKSNDDLFSNSSSESRSHKSFDLPAAGESQYDVKITSDRGGGGGLFDEDIDIFGSGDAPQIDIFGEAFNPSNFVSRGSSHRPVTKDESSASKVNNSSSNKIDSLVEKNEENPKVSTKSGFFQESLVKSTSIFDDSEDDNDDDLFAPSFLKSNRAPRKIMSETEDDEIFTNKPTRNTGPTTLSETKKESASSLVGEKVANATSAEREIAKRDSHHQATEKRLPSFSNSGLFDNLDEKNVDDGLFASDVSNDEGTSEKREDKLLADVGSSGDSKNEEFATNRAKFEEMLKSQSIDESSTKKSPPKETDFDFLPKKITPETSPLKSDDSPKKFIEDDKETSSTDGGKISKASNSPELIGDSTKRHPPKTLSIRLPVASDDSSQPPPRRVVSDKIKHLKGKMGDFKVLSPTDTPPVWRKSKEKTDSECEKTESRDIEDGGNMSVLSTAASPTLSPTKNINQLIETSDEIAQNSPPDDSGNSESAVSFDVPAQVEVLAVTASKSRARIQAKRRPQSRHARHSALRKSGIDFDTVDNTGSEAVESDPSDKRFSGISDKISTVVGDSSGPESSRTDRLGGKESEGEKLAEKTVVETSCSLAPEDRSEMSFSKGSSLSLNKNTLLSPSTDEEDLFDVPPDLPEDPPKEDTLFGRAPILSPIDRSLGRKTGRSKDKPREKNSNLESEESSRMRETKKSSEEGSKREKSSESESTGDKPIDPLRDNSHDPLKDPSQLFAFVTKTPSPEKGQNVLFKEDASLFTHLAKKTAEEAKSKRAVLDLFADDNAGDLFTETLAKSTKKPIRAVKSDSLFDEVDNTDEDFATNLFGARSKIAREKSGKMEDSVATKSNETSGRASPERGSIFASADADDLFVNLPPKKVSPEPEKRVENKEKNTKDTSSKTRDIFGDESSGEEDLFTKSKSIASGKGVTASSSIFSAGPDDDDADDIFATKTSSKSAKHEPTENRPTLKKAVTRDLKKTAETIVQDPLSMLQDD